MTSADCRMRMAKGLAIAGFAAVAFAATTAAQQKPADPKDPRVGLKPGLRDAGVLPVALAYGTSAIEALSVELDLPLLAKFRAQ